MDGAKPSHQSPPFPSLVHSSSCITRSTCAVYINGHGSQSSARRLFYMSPHTPTGCFSWLRRNSTRRSVEGGSQVAPPTAAEYTFAAGKQTLEILQRFSQSLPIPCANEALELALLLMTTYEVRSDTLERLSANVSELGCYRGRAAC